MKDVSITLVNESCFSFLKELESNSIDLALIDPPYEVSRETNFKSGEAKGKDTDRFRVSMDFGDWDSDFTGLDEVIKELYRVLRKGGTLICFYDIWKISILRRYFDDAKFRQIRFIEWVKTKVFCTSTLLSGSSTCLSFYKSKAHSKHSRWAS